MCMALIVLINMASSKLYNRKSQDKSMYFLSSVHNASFIGIYNQDIHHYGGHHSGDEHKNYTLSSS